MSREAARARAAALNRSLPEGADHHWIAHHAGTRWEVVRVRVAGERFAAAERVERSEAARGPEREPPTDPRSTIQRLIPPYGPS